MVSASHTDRQSTFLVRTDGPIHDPAWTVGRLGLEDSRQPWTGVWESAVFDAAG